MNRNLMKLDALESLTVLSATTPAPTVTTNGTRYIVPAGATGAFATQDGQVAVRVGGAWTFYIAPVGMQARVQDTGQILVWSSSGWVDALSVQPYLDVSNPGGWTLPNGTAWTAIQLFTKTADNRNGWSASTYRYTVPLTGVYIVQAVLRPLRTGTNSMPVNTTLALGVGTSAGDSVDVVAATAVDLNEFTVALSKPMLLTAGQQVFPFGKHSGAGPVAFTYAQFKLVRVSSFV